MAGKELGFGIIGCGTIANWHAGAVGQVEGARLVGAADVSAAMREAFAAKYGVRPFDSVEALLECPEVDVVSICTPSGLHAPLAVQAAGAGKHVVLEKPMALTLQQADGIIRACEATGVKLAVISQMRFAPAVSALKRAVDEGWLGRPVSGDLTMKYYRSQQYYDSSGWRGTWAMDGGGALMNQGIHGVDLLQYVMGPVRSVFAYTRTLARRIEVEDTAAAVLEFASGALGVVQATTSVCPGQPRRLEVNGDRGTIVLEEDCISSWEVEGRDPPEGVVVGHTRIASASSPGDFGLENHIRQIADMVDAVRSDRAPFVDAAEGRKSVEIITAIYESSRTGRPVELARPAADKRQE